MKRKPRYGRWDINGKEWWCNCFAFPIMEWRTIKCMSCNTHRPLKGRGGERTK